MNRRNFFGLAAVAPLGMLVSAAPIQTGRVAHQFHSKECLPPEKIAELMTQACLAGICTVAEARAAVLGTFNV